MATTDAPCMLHLLLVCFLQACLSQHASALWQCHCTSGCDVNFRCSSDCLQGWSGPTCERRNIALNRPTQQSSTLNDCKWANTSKGEVCGEKNSSLAVDGVVSSNYWSGTCTHTALNQTLAWWTVDLGETHLITNLTIFFLRQDRFRNFLVRVDDRPCYQSQTNSPSSPVNISCDTPTRGQYVTVQLPTLAGSHYILNLCEVEIYECADGSFGSGCSSWCYCRNTSEVCDKTTGHCESGCKDGYTGTGCQKTCPEGRYGSGCMETCGHCTGGDQNCHNVNGTCRHGCQEYWSGTLCKARECHCTSDGCDADFRCPSGCLQGWSGPTCQRRNIALNRPTQQSSTVNDCKWADTAAKRGVCGDKTSSLAVDGVVSSSYWSGTCTHTATGRTSAGWSVDLGETHLITNLKIFFSHPGRIRGFLVRVDDRPCYQSQTNRPSSPVDISCDTPTRGQRVTVQLPTLAGSEYILSLCEVEIYECADGSFGPGCSSWCYCRNTSEVCDKTTGHCEGGCKDGRNGTDCQGLCADGRFGPGCSSRCYCRNTSEVCDKTTGHCEGGCKDGYTGMGCRENCPKGRYGSGCMETCGHCAGGDGNCYEIDGYCTDGCQDNWSGTVCKECSDYWFGDQCDRECRCKDAYEVCDKRTGQCHSGCEDGWTGLDCQTQCDEGRYGDGCSEACGQCAGKCSPVNGSCDQEGCRDGWKGQRCDDVCADGRFGPGCSSRCYCRNTSEVCDKTTGHCEGGCKDGYTGMGCRENCPKGTLWFWLHGDVWTLCWGDRNCDGIDGT
ncbi:multiple epidermal growth factor-like domains protein 10, partial [Haliotis rubra]|uniref:multiple epidermal growth factor-like domains protein 10 n=1 Tax=Haliotis rubra TaxID=36100 RepID=UPI001EE572F5